jgi:hypothetical protein
MHCGERSHVWEFQAVEFFTQETGVPSWPMTWGARKNHRFVCVGGHNGMGCGATMSVADAAVALTSRQNCAIELAEAREDLARYTASDWPQVLEERDEAQGTARGWENVAGHARRQADEAIRDLAEARGIAGELFRAYRELFNPKVRQYFEAYRLGDWSEVTEAYRRIRPEVRRRLEWK